MCFVVFGGSWGGERGWVNHVGETDFNLVNKYVQMYSWYKIGTAYLWRISVVWMARNLI